MLAYFLQGLLIGFPAVATPGPLQVYYLSQTARVGWRRTLPTAFAPLFSDGPIILLVLVILTRTPDWMLRGLRIAGGLFVLYLAVDAFVAFRRGYADQSAMPDTAQGGLAKAVMTNLLNPNPYIFWSVVAGPLLIAAWRESPLDGFGLLLGFYGTLVGGFALLIILYGAAGRLSDRVQNLASGVSALALLAFGIYQLWTGILG